ncbi:helix-turn-helix domain-containing protein [Pseudofrankia inefficax]|uniref:DNA binding domain protein, excisionase family n=1 Tax=Pseudofrankia inefficax (strain DSM 45817 / CECT 9037 / DDB 130130 / EuI1c) TaxID=298654 RepID=E3IUL5_PSEI1|nr:helix-turn-helix domain-containing protein [Pseudofrankia inefficax]ADP84831.1 DNA binding domain protein, excisionase family [Pseudofrankia inefficax]
MTVVAFSPDRPPVSVSESEFDAIRAALHAALARLDDLAANARPVPPPSPAGAPVLLTVEEAARLLRISRTVLYDLIGDGEIPAVRIGRLRRLRLADVETFAERRVEPGGGNRAA